MGKTNQQVYVALSILTLIYIKPLIDLEIRKKKTDFGEECFRFRRRRNRGIFGGKLCEKVPAIMVD